MLQVLNLMVGLASSKPQALGREGGEGGESGWGGGGERGRREMACLFNTT